jgi:hypothetical protein
MACLDEQPALALASLRAAGAHCSPASYDEITLDVGKYFSESPSTIGDELLRSYLSLSQASWHSGIKYRILRARAAIASQLREESIARTCDSTALTEASRIADQLSGDFLEVFLSNPWMPPELATATINE